MRVSGEVGIARPANSLIAAGVMVSQLGLN
jgi:hypothetical protein